MIIFFKKVALLLSLSIALSGHTSAILDVTTAKDLYISPENNIWIGDCFEAPSTQKGHDELLATLNNPTTNVELLTQRQHALKALLAEPEILLNLSQELQSIGKNERCIGAFFNPQQQTPMLTSSVESFMYSLSRLKHFNSSPAALDVRHVLQSFSPLIMTVLEFGALHFAGRYFTDSKEGNHEGNHEKHDHKDKKVKKPTDGNNCPCTHHIDTSLLPGGFVRNSIRTAKAAHIIFHGVSLKDMYEVLTTKIATLSHIQKQLNELAASIESAKKVSSLLQKYGTNQLLTKFAQEIEAALKKIHVPKKARSISMTSRIGHIITGYNQAIKDWDVLVALSKIIGSIDMYCSIARTLQAHESTALKYCFVTFTEQNLPLFHITNGWIPLLEKSNSATEITQQTFHTSDYPVVHFVLSGANGSGKSTFLRTLGCNAVLAQTLGIAAATELTMTLLHAITSFIRANDDIAEGTSNFIAKLIRSQFCLKKYEECKNNGRYGLFLLDDSLGQGTSIEKGEKFACNVIKTIGSSDIALLVAATHYQSPTKLEALYPAFFYNLQTQLEYNGASIQSSFRIIPGHSNPELVDILAKN